jgi:hypothetical protein
MGSLTLLRRRIRTGLEKVTLPLPKRTTMKME